jgi:hypothetical protein
VNASSIVTPETATVVHDFFLQLARGRRRHGMTIHFIAFF